RHRARRPRGVLGRAARRAARARRLRPMRRAVTRALVALLGCAALACGGDATPTPPPSPASLVASVRIVGPDSVLLGVRAQYTLEVRDRAGRMMTAPASTSWAIDSAQGAGGV